MEERKKYRTGQGLLTWLSVMKKRLIARGWKLSKKESRSCWNLYYDNGHRCLSCELCSSGSSPIIVVDNPPFPTSPYIPTPPPPTEKLPVEDNSKLLLARGYLAMMELQWVIESFEVSIPKTVKDRMCGTRSSSSHEIPLLT
ncbi:hypothetical protein PVK06_011681 [Gossypium arboreum]|uniref:Uncharacterized protein n=1 Tax=Gossypium arboreum TaxID=29729 RepID=A0ABR0Q9Z4_GOSAR|nr:hypothetical protein PVK06_011681 [Gossypium arboreum]